MNLVRVLPLLLVWVATNLSGQEPPAADLSAIRTKTDLSDEDRAQIRNFVAERVGTIVTGPAGQTRPAGDELRDGYSGSDVFKREYLGACLEAIGSAYKQAGTVSATRLVTILNSFQAAESSPLLIEALRDERVGVRAAAAIGLRGLRAKVAANRDAYQRVLDELKQAGKKERSPTALKAIYEAMNYADIPAAPDQKGNLSALLEVLEARAGLYGSTDQVPGLGADEVGLKAAQSLAKATEDAERQRLLVVAATIMRYAVWQYVSSAVTGPPGQYTTREARQQQEALERLILVGEELLAGLLKPEKPPAVADYMKKANVEEMKAQWQSWVELLQKTVNRDFSLPATESPIGSSADRGSANE